MLDNYKVYKKNFDYSYSIGVSPTIELIENKSDSIEKIFISSKGTKNLGMMKIINMCEADGIAYEENDKKIQQLSKAENAYALGVFRKYSTDLERNENHVLLDNPSDMGNLGTIIRTALGFGIKNIALIKPATDFFDPKVVRSSMGAIFKINIFYFNNIEEYINNYKRSFYPFMLQAKNDFEKTEFISPCTLMFGNEGSGLPTKYADIGIPVRISQTNEIDSLNLAVSVGIACYKIYTSHS